MVDEISAECMPFAADRFWALQASLNDSLRRCWALQASLNDISRRLSAFQASLNDTFRGIEVSSLNGLLIPFNRTVPGRGRFWVSLFAENCAPVKFPTGVFGTRDFGQ